jgi:chromosome segregation ATPase
MGRPPRDHEADRAAISAAADRLLAGTPLRSPSGKLTASELITESGLRRDIVYRHTDLIQDFQARAKAQDSTPTAMQELADENRKLKSAVDDLKGELRQEQARSKTMRMIIAELALELEQAKAELAGLAGVTWLPDRR